MQTPTEDSTPSSDGTAAELPAPSTRSHWRWSPTRRVLVGGSVLAAVLGLGSVAAGAATSSSGQPPAGASGGPPPGMAKPTAAGKITAISGDNLTLQDLGTSTTTVVYSSSTTFKTRSGTTSASALKVGDFVAVSGTKSSDGTVNATTIVIGAPPGQGGPGGHPGGKPPTGKPPAGRGMPAPQAAGATSS